MNGHPMYNEKTNIIKNEKISSPDDIFVIVPSLRLNFRNNPSLPAKAMYPTDEIITPIPRDMASTPAIPAGNKSRYSEKIRIIVAPGHGTRLVMITVG